MKILSKRTLKNILRYLLLFFTVFIATQLIQECKIGMRTSLIIASIVVLSFILLDIYLPLEVSNNKYQRRLFRFIIIFLIVFISTRFIQECPINYTTSFIISTVSIIIFSLLDMYFPLIVSEE